MSNTPGNTPMDAAQEARRVRGIEMAERFNIVKRGDVWTVPSATGKHTYTVNVNDDFECCSCPDFEESGYVCKHIFATRTVLQRQLQFETDGTVTETVVTQTQTISRKIYPQASWPAYHE